MNLPLNPRWLVGVALFDLDAVCGAAKDAFLSGSKSKARLVEEWAFVVAMRGEGDISHDMGCAYEIAITKALEPLQRAKRVRTTPLVDLMGGQQ